MKGTVGDVGTTSPLARNELTTCWTCFCQLKREYLKPESRQQVNFSNRLAISLPVSPAECKCWLICGRSRNNGPSKDMPLTRLISESTNNIAIFSDKIDGSKEISKLWSNFFNLGNGSICTSELANARLGVFQCPSSMLVNDGTWLEYHHRTRGSEGLRYVRSSWNSSQMNLMLWA